MRVTWTDAADGWTERSHGWRPIAEPGPIDYPETLACPEVQPVAGWGGRPGVTLELEGTPEDEIVNAFLTLLSESQGEVEWNIARAGACGPEVAEYLAALPEVQDLEPRQIRVGWGTPSQWINCTRE